MSDEIRRLREGAEPEDAGLRELVQTLEREKLEPDRVAGVAAKLGPILNGGPPAGGGGGGGAEGAAGIGSGGVGASMQLKLAALVVGGGIAVVAGVIVLDRSAGSGPQPSAPTVAPLIVEVDSVAEPEEFMALPARDEPIGALPEARTEDHRPSPRDVREEERLLRRARLLVASDPAGALELAVEHRHRFPRGILAQEREVVAVDALGRLGRRDAAEARGARFLKRWPGSAHRARIEALLGTQ